MRILMCNSFYYLRGGSERCFFDLTELLTANGHEVIPFSMIDERNAPTKYSDYFISHIDFPSRMQKDSSLGSKLGAVERAIYSREAAQKVGQLIADTKPDIAHVHGIAHETSPSILPVIARAGLPIVQTLHDYKLLCPNTNFFSNGSVCERCKRHRYYQVVLQRCKRNSLPASLLAGLEMYSHKLAAIYERHVDTFVVPSQFLGDRLREYGIRNETVHIPNFLHTDRFEPCYEPEEYFIYSGRLVKEKGVRTLLEAMRQVKRSHLYIAGSGDLEPDLREYAEANSLRNVTFLGHLSSDRLISLMRKARFAVVPSEWYENYSMSVIESLACGTPVIGAAIGGIPEQVWEGWNGLLFESGNAQQLAAQINSLLDKPELAVELGRNGRRQVEEINNPQRHYQQTVALYDSLLVRKRVPRP